jgi:hypothetical protein
MEMVFKTKEEARTNFEAALAVIPDRYVKSVSRADWKSAAASDQAEANFTAQMQKVISEKRRLKGVQAVDNKDWQTAAVTKGAPIIADRIRMALPDWEKTWGPMYDSVIDVVSRLPPRTVDWRANINTRLVKTVEAWKRASGQL